MQIDWQNFTPISALIGGGLIGVAAAVFVIFNGRIAGISGITGGLFQAKRQDILWRVAFIAGVILAPMLYGLLMPLTVPHIASNWFVLMIAGLCVGIGTRYGSGCTSGHGVCGLARLSPRSMVATGTFMLMGFATVYIIRHLIMG